MRILVVNEPFQKGFCRTQRWAARTRGRVMRPPDWLAYITAVLEHDGHAVRFYDFPAQDWERGHFVQLINKHKPDAVVLDSTTPSIYSDLEYAALVKAYSGSQVIMVGPHASVLSEETLELGQGAVDIIIRGEPEQTAVEVFGALERGQSLKTIQGITYYEQGHIVHNPDRAFMEDLDKLPFPAWHHLDLRRYFDGIKLYPFIDIIGGRGCPYQCMFCLWPQVMHGNRYRLRSPDNIVSEMVYDLDLWPWLRKGEFFFEDDTFTVHHHRALEICSEIQRLRPPVTWSVNARADHGDPELFRAMKRAGCRMLLIGYESGDQAILDRIGKRLRVTDARERACEAHQAGLKLHGCFVFGLPGETRETMEKTIDYALSLPLDTVQFSAAVPFPGTHYYEYCQENGLLQALRWDDWLTAGEQTAVVDYPQLSRQDITLKVDEALKRFYFRAGYLARFIGDTRSLGDLYRKLRGGSNFIRYLFTKRTESRQKSG
ncbi:radical SAM protein [bacterium]|nr:radical SAM protein [bacterium]